MRTSRRFLIVLTVVALGAGALAAPATARREGRPHARTAIRAVVKGRDAGVSERRPTSFEVFGRRFGSKGTSAVSSSTAIARAPSSLAGFDALSDPNSQPSDTTGARGDTFIVAAVNTQVAVYDLNGVQVVAPIQLDALHPDSVGHFTFDPKVVYDPYNDTFVIAYVVEEDSPRLSLIITVAIPNATASTVGTWCSTSFPGDGVPSSPDVWADYPGLGYNDTRVTITTNQFTFPSSQGQFRSSQVMTLDKAALYDCNLSAPVPTIFAGTQTRDNLGNQAFTLRPAETVGTSPGAQLMVSFALVQGKNDYLTVWRIKPTASGFTLKKASGLTGKVSFPPLGSQEGGGLNDPDKFWDTGDARLINAFYDADRNELFTAHTVFKNLKPDTVTGAYPEAVNRWYEINPATNLRNSDLSRKGLIGDTEVDVGWPSVASDASGTLFVTYSRASEPRNEFISAWVSTIQPNSTSDTEFLLHAGSATFDALNGVERWGDYTAINRDPLVSQNVATFNQYAAASTQWQQFISLVTDV